MTRRYARFFEPAYRKRESSRIVLPVFAIIAAIQIDQFEMSGRILFDRVAYREKQERDGERSEEREAVIAERKSRCRSDQSVPDSPSLRFSDVSVCSLRRGPGANVQDTSGYSALHHAAVNGHRYHAPLNIVMSSRR